MDKTMVSQIMTTTVITVRPTDTMDRVSDIFRTNNIHHIPVVEENKVVGILSKSDFYRLQHTFSFFKNERSEAYNDALMRSLLVREVMTKQVAKLQPEDTLELAVGFFRENLFHALPVVDKEGNLVGIITTFDLLTHAYNDHLQLQS